MLPLLQTVNATIAQHYVSDSRASDNIVAYFALPQVVPRDGSARLVDLTGHRRSMNTLAKRRTPIHRPHGPVSSELGVGMSVTMRLVPTLPCRLAA